MFSKYYILYRESERVQRINISYLCVFHIISNKRILIWNLLQEIASYNKSMDSFKCICIYMFSSNFVLVSTIYTCKYCFIRSM